MPVLALTDQPEALEPLCAELGPDVVQVSDTAAGLAALGGEWSLVLLDADGLGEAAVPLVRRLSEAGHSVALMARCPTVELTLKAVRAGAQEVLPLPPDAERIRELLEERAAGPGGPAAAAPEELGGIVGQSRPLLEAIRTVARVASSTATVLLRGESGTGKELLARVIHEQSPRARKPFVAVNCAAIPETLLESELFGHERGAFTGAIGRRIGRVERASGGTLFLDEIGDMSLALQAKLLRVLQEREIERVGGDAPVRVDVRLVAATHRDLEADVAARRFREDLYYRLAVVTIDLPPLRRRGDDIPLLAEYYLRRAALEHGRPVRQLDPQTVALLRAHPWPGNIRQLRNAIERAVLLAEGPVLRPMHLPPDIRSPAARPGVPAMEASGTLEEVERRYIEQVLDQTGGHMARAAELLGIHRNTLRRKLEGWGLA